MLLVLALRKASLSKRPTAGKSSNTVLNDIDAYIDGVEAATIPTHKLSMPRVSRLRHDFQEFLEPRGATNIFRWRSALTINKARIFDPRTTILYFLDRDRVLPVIAEVIGVFEGRDPTLDKRRDVDVASRKGFSLIEVFWIRHIVTPATSLELEQMIILEQHHRLNDIVEPLQAHREWNLDAVAAAH